jgi:hypothetical protein
MQLIWLSEQLHTGFLRILPQTTHFLTPSTEYLVLGKHEDILLITNIPPTFGNIHMNTALPLTTSGHWILEENFQN